MSEEQRRDEDSEVEAHRRRWQANDEPSGEADDENEVEAHIRMDMIRKD